MTDEPSIEPPDPAWHIGALVEDRAVLSGEILRFLVTLEGKGYSPETIGRVLGPIFGLYVRDHLRGNPRWGLREKILDGLPATMRPELVEQVALELGYRKGAPRERKPGESEG